MNRDINNVIRVPTSLKGDFFKIWFMFLKPFHNLTDREIEVISIFLRYRLELCEVITDNDILNKVIFSDDIKKKVREEVNMTLPHFQVVMGKLRKSPVLKDGYINPRFIPNVVKEGNTFKLLLLFDLNDE